MPDFQSSKIKAFIGYTQVTMKAEAGRRVRFLGIDRCVEVSKILHDRLVTVTIKSAPLAAMTEMGSNSWLVYRSESGRHLSDALPMSLRLTDIWIVWVVQNLARHPPDVCDALPDIGQALSTDLLAISLQCKTPHQVLSPS